MGVRLMNISRLARSPRSRPKFDAAIKNAKTDKAPRTIALLTSFLYRAAGDLGAAATNARTEAEADHARKGRALCVEMFVRLTPSAATDLRVDVPVSGVLPQPHTTETGHDEL